MTENDRLTHQRASGQGFWSNRKKDELVERLAAYENTGVTPEEISQMLKAGLLLESRVLR